MKSILRSSLPVPAVLVASLLLGFVAVGCGGDAFDPASAVPEDARVLAQLRLADLRAEGPASEFAAGWLEKFEADPKYAKFREETGLDPIQEVDRILIAAGTNPNKGEMMAVFEGSFDPDKILQSLQEQEGYQSEDVQGTVIHFVTDQSGQRAGFFFPKEGYAVGAGEGWAGTAVDALAGRTGSVAGNEKIQSLLDRLDRNDPFWVVSQVADETGASVVNASPLGRILGDVQVQSILASVDPPEKAAGDLGFQLMVGAQDPASAAKLESMAAGGIQFAKMMVMSSSPRTTELMDKLQFSVDGDMAKMELRCDGALLEDVLKELEAMRQPGGPLAPRGAPPMAPYGR
jgi:hypothetical protein